MENEKYTARDILANLHYQTDKRLSFNNFIQRLRKDVFRNKLFIMNNVSYDEMVYQLVDLELLPREILINMLSEDDYEV